MTLTPEAAAKIAKRSMCPTCEGREPRRTEEAYASCVFCASGSAAPATTRSRNDQRSASTPHTLSA